MTACVTCNLCPWVIPTEAEGEVLVACFHGIGVVGCGEIMDSLTGSGILAVAHQIMDDKILLLPKWCKSHPFSYSYR